MVTGFITKKRNAYQVVIRLGTGDERQTRWFSVRKELGLKRPAKYSEAKALLAEKLSIFGESQTFDKTDISLGQFMKQWLETKRSKVAETTHELYEGMIRVHLQTDHIARVKLDKLTPLAMQTYVERMIAANKSARVIGTVVMILRQALNAAVDWEMITRSPATKLDLPKAFKPEKRIWSDEDAAKFLEVIHGEDLELVYVMAMTTGMRRGEILGLTWDRVDYKEPAVHIARSLNRKGHLTAVKTDASVRKVSIDIELSEALREHQRTQLERLMAIGKRNEHNAVFLTSVGTLYSPRNVLRHFQALCSKHGLAEVDIHSLRHLHVSWLIEQGVDFKTIQERVGHKRLQTTIDIYGHLLENMRKKAVAATSTKMSALKNGRQEVDKRAY